MRMHSAILAGLGLFAISANACVASMGPASKEEIARKYQQAPFASADKAAIAYHEIEVAARNACRPFGPRRTADYPRIHNCKRLFAKQAIGAIDDPLLNSVAGVAPKKDDDVSSDCMRSTHSFRHRGPWSTHHAQAAQRSCSRVNN